MGDINMRSYLFTAAAGLMLLTAGSANAEACLTFDEDHAITLRGEIVQSATTEESEGEPPHKFMALVLDTPVCFIGDDDRVAFLPVVPSRKSGWAITSTPRV
jgi:hypothetical protein